MTNTYSLVHLDEMYMTEDIENPRKGDWVYEYDNNIPIYMFDYDMEQYPLPKIVASTDKVLGLPLLPAVEDTVEQLAENYVVEESYLPVYKEECKRAYMNGYNAASAKKWSDEDLETLLILRRQKHSMGDNQVIEHFKKLLRLKPVAVVVYEENGKLLQENGFVKVHEWIYE